MNASLDSTRPSEKPVWPVLAVTCMVGTFALVVGYTYPALSFAMEAAGFSRTVIGLQTAMSGLGVAISAVLTPPVAIRVGPWRLGVVAGIITIVTLISFGFTEPGYVWFLLRFILGAAISALFVLSETWLNELAPPALRGRLVAVYTTTVAAMFGVGPLLIPFVGYSGTAPFVIVGGFATLLLLPLFLLRGQVPPLEPARNRDMLAVFWIIPVLIAAVATFGIFDGATMGLWVVYGVELGYSDTIASWTLSAAILGNLFLQIPIGWLADRMSRKTLLSICVGASVLGASLIPFLDLDAWYIWPFLMVWGGMCFGIYTIALTVLGEHLRGALLISANAAFGLMWGVGAILGGALAGGMMDLVGPYGLPAFIFAIFLILFVMTVTIAPVRAVQKT
ncbi:MAG: MFS transporter [Pseudomonadota bacterium]